MTSPTISAASQPPLSKIEQAKAELCGLELAPRLAEMGGEGWEALDAHEVALGEASGRERIKVVPREEMLRIARSR